MAATDASSVRLFVGLMVAPEIAREFVRLAECLAGPSVRRIAPADMHLTLVPPWHEASIPAAVEKLHLAASASRAFSLTFGHVGFGPEPARPRMLWVDCMAGEDIAALRAALLQAYGQTDERLFRPHVTLARIRGNGRRIARTHPIDQDLSLSQRIESVELFQSPPPGGSGYRIIASARLGETGHAVPAA